MASILLAWNNKVDAATLGGTGSWETALPLTNMQDRQVQKVARTTGVTTANTQWTVDLGAADISIGAIAIIAHNLSEVAQIKITASTSNTFSPVGYTTDWVDVWAGGSIPIELLEWESNSFWFGTMTANERAGYNAPYILVPPTSQVFRYWKIELDDTTNVDGYIQVGRLFMARGWTPSADREQGASWGFEDPTGVETSLTGAEYYDTKARYRVHRFELQCLTKSEAYSYVHELQRLAGTSGEILVVPDSTDSTTIYQSSIVGRMRSIDPVVQKIGGSDGLFYTSFEIKELI